MIASTSTATMATPTPTHCTVIIRSDRRRAAPSRAAVGRPLGAVTALDETVVELMGAEPVIVVSHSNGRNPTGRRVSAPFSWRKARG